MPVQVRPPAFKMKTDLLVIRERFFLNYAGMAELADAQDSDSCPRKSGAGSSPVIRIKLS